MINSARHVLPLAVVAAAALGITGCTVASAPTAEAEASAAPTTASPLAPTASPLPAEVATSDLGAQLRYLIEEEKLAHDVYTVLGDLWGGNVFVNIAASETTHQDAVAALLAEHAIVDPRADEVGVFSDPDLQALYDQLVADGSQSRAAAIDVGVLIEQTDIADLTRALDGADDDVAVVLERLLAGSQNHLAAFERQA
ncbi:MAG: hypothetical protein BGO47_00880 [Microbacterium sp. 67-17]|jgi:hypothetical protein|uniref:DUF2202 domain-containing protein n=1 Tax=Microbacterium sp. 67-17 TaxID=1895782 RepID=UPI0009613586|nr:DUF2202 domain-containing protein [Microbacterium sp. 67-17]OJV98546.1 MAG: hypothetical protein BGO47_00880 [Microbacterium sp. 67-17]